MSRQRKETEPRMVKVQRVLGQKIRGVEDLEIRNKLLNYEIVEISSEDVSTFTGIKVVEDEVANTEGEL